MIHDYNHDYLHPKKVCAHACHRLVSLGQCCLFFKMGGPWCPHLSSPVVASDFVRAVRRYGDHGTHGMTGARRGSVRHR